MPTELTPDGHIKALRSEIEELKKTSIRVDRQGEPGADCGRIQQCTVDCPDGGRDTEHPQSRARGLHVHMQAVGREPDQCQAHRTRTQLSEHDSRADDWAPEAAVANKQKESPCLTGSSRGKLAATREPGAIQRFSHSLPWAREAEQQ